MPLIFNNKVADQKANLGIWELQESVNSLLSLASLNKTDAETFYKLRNENRKKQWLASRIILNKISGKNEFSVLYEKTGRPIISDGIHQISISHTSKYIAVIIAKSIKVGVDIERIHPRILKVSHKFVSHEEDHFLKSHENLEESLILIWSAKETLFKLNGQANMDFRTNIHINPFEIKNKGLVMGSIQKKPLLTEHQLYYQKIDDHFLVYSVGTI